MTGTLVVDSNIKFFLPILDIEKEQIDGNQLIIGVIDDESGAACGVLRAEAGDAEELFVRYIYVDEKFRNLGAGAELVRFLLEISEEMTVKSIRCFYIRDKENSYLYNILDNAGFSDESEFLDEYLVKESDFDLEELKAEPKGVKTFKLCDVPEDIRAFLPVSLPGYYDEERSILAIDNNGSKGTILFHPFGNYLELDSLTAHGDNQSLILYALIREAVLNSRELGGDKWVLVNLSTDIAKELLNRFSLDFAVKFDECVLFTLKLD